MNQPWVVVVLTLVGVAVLKLLLLLILGKGSLARVGLATRLYTRVLGDPGLAGRAESLLAPPPPPEPPKPVKRSGERSAC